MASWNVSLPINWKIEVSANDLKEYVEADERLKPCVFIIPTSYASSLEMGAGPYISKMSESEIIELRRDIRTWLRRKKGVTDKQELDRSTERVVASLLYKGMRARPFFRPAFYWASDNLQSLFDEGYSLMQILEHMAQKTNENIMFNVYAPPGSEYMPYTGTLQMGWILRYLTDEEAKGAVGKAEDVDAIADRVWNDGARGKRGAKG